MFCCGYTTTILLVLLLLMLLLLIRLVDYYYYYYYSVEVYSLLAAVLYTRQRERRIARGTRFFYVINSSQYHILIMNMYRFHRHRAYNVCRTRFRYKYYVETARRNNVRQCDVRVFLKAWHEAARARHSWKRVWRFMCDDWRLVVTGSAPTALSTASRVVAASDDGETAAWGQEHKTTLSLRGGAITATLFALDNSETWQCYKHEWD